MYFDTRASCARTHLKPTRAERAACVSLYIVATLLPANVLEACAFVTFLVVVIFIRGDDVDDVGDVLATC